MKIIYRLLFVFVLPLNLFGQTASVKGIISDDSGKPVSGVQIKIKGKNYSALSGSTGNFQMQNIPYGEYEFEFSSSVFFPVSIKQNINQSALSISSQLKLSAKHQAALLKHQASGQEYLVLLSVSFRQ